MGRVSLDRHAWLRAPLFYKHFYVHTKAMDVCRWSGGFQRHAEQPPCCFFTDIRFGIFCVCASGHRTCVADVVDFSGSLSISLLLYFWFRSIVF